MIRWKEKNTLIDTRCTRKAVTTTAGMGNPRLFQLCTCASISLSHTEAHVYEHTHLSLALLVFSPWHEFLCSLAFIQAHPFPGRQAMYFLCTFNSKYTYVFPMGAHTLLPFPHVQGGIETVHHHHMHPLLAFFFSSPAPCQHWQRTPYSFCSNLLAKGGEDGRLKLLFFPALLTARTCQNRLAVSWSDSDKTPHISLLFSSVPLFVIQTPYRIVDLFCFLHRHFKYKVIVYTRV